MTQTTPNTNKGTTTMTSQLDRKINALQSGQSIEISRANGIVCFAERSGDGKTIRFVRVNGDTTNVFLTASV